MHFPLHPNTPPEGRAIAELFRGRNVDLAAMNQRMRDEMSAEGLPYGKRTHTYNSRLAQELGTWGDTLPEGTNTEEPSPGDRLHDACLLYTSPSPRDGLLSRMPSSA